MSEVRYKYKSGAGSELQAMNQTSWGTIPTGDPDVKINMTSESINLGVTKESEGSLLQAKTETSRDITGFTVDGSFSTILKPDFVDWLLFHAMGIRGITVSDSTNYTLAASGAELPLSTLVVRRGGAATSSEPTNWNVFTYPDVTISSLTLTAPAQQYVTADVNIMGTKELAGSETGAKTLNSNLNFVSGSYKCTSASLKIGSDTYPVESTTITIDNGMAEAPATYLSGLYKDQPIMGQRNVTVEFTMPYGSGANSIRNTYFKDEDNPNCSIELQFATKKKYTSGSQEFEAQTIKVILPNVTLTDASGNVGGADMIDSSFSGIALTVNGVEPITIAVFDHQDGE